MTYKCADRGEGTPSSLTTTWPLSDHSNMPCSTCMRRAPYMPCCCQHQCSTTDATAATLLWVGPSTAWPLCCALLLCLQVFDIASGEQVALLSQGHYDTVTACAYSPHSQQLFSAATDGVLLVWEPWTQPDADGSGGAAAADVAGHLDRDWWMAAASGRRQQQQQPSGLAFGSARAASRPTAADIDAWSEE